jgi:hypothetical protein
VYLAYQIKKPHMIGIPINFEMMHVNVREPIPALGQSPNISDTRIALRGSKYVIGLDDPEYDPELGLLKPHIRE